MLEHVKNIYFGYKNKRSKYEVKKVAIWQHFLISGKQAYPFLIQGSPNAFFLENGLKKLLNIISNIFFYLKVQSFRSKMENNFIQMASSAGHAVSYTIGPICKHIIDCVQLYFTNDFRNIGLCLDGTLQVQWCQIAVAKRHQFCGINGFRKLAFKVLIVSGLSLTASYK